MGCREKHPPLFHHYDTGMLLDLIDSLYNVGNPFQHFPVHVTQCKVVPDETARLVRFGYYTIREQGSAAGFHTPFLIGSE